MKLKEILGLESPEQLQDLSFKFFVERGKGVIGLFRIDCYLYNVFFVQL